MTVSLRACVVVVVVVGYAPRRRARMAPSQTSLTNAPRRPSIRLGTKRVVFSKMRGCVTAVV